MRMEEVPGVSAGVREEFRKVVERLRLPDPVWAF
jgi:hypothetical protein